MQIESVNSQTLAHILGISQRRVQQLGRSGVLPKAGRDRYDLPSVVQAWGAWLVSGKATGDLSAEKKKLLAAQARKMTVEAKKAEGAVFDRDDVRVVVNAGMAALVQGLESLPGRLSGGDPALHHRLKNEVRRLRTELSDQLAGLASRARK